MAEEQAQKINPFKVFFQKGSVRLFLWLLFAIVFCECEVRIVAGVQFFGPGLLFIVLFGAVLALALTAVCSLFPPRPALILSHVFMALVIATYIVQLFYYFVFGTYLTLFSLLNGTDALQFGDSISATLATCWPYIVILLTPGILYFICARRLAIVRSGRNAAVAAVAAVILHFTAVICLYIFGMGYFTPFDYYYNNPSLNQSVDKLGLLTTFRLDTQRYLFGMPGNEGAAAQQAGEPPAAIPTAVPTPTATPAATERPAATAGEPQAGRAPEPVEYGYNVLDIDFAALMEETDDAALQEMHAYFAGVEPTRQNAHTGMFEGYNLITVTAEAFAPYAIDEKLTPTLYKMANEGFVFTDFYCPEWTVSTSDGEYVNCLGLIPKQGVWSMYLSGSRENYLPFAFGNQFRALGYETNAYHNNEYTYYNRHISHPNLGYNYIGVGNGMEIDATWPESDWQMVDVTTGDFIDGGPFHTYYLTVSGHMAYTYGGNEMAQKHWSLVEDLPLSEEAKAYLACNIELDRAMALLLERLEKAGVAERTVIAIAPDHPPYGLTMEQTEELAGRDIDRTFGYNESVFILYNPGMEREVVDEPVCTLDVVPTISNLFGLPYDSRLLMGRDVFSDAEPLVILGDRSWVTERARFNSGTGEVVWNAGYAEDAAYVEAVNKIVADKFTYSPRMLDTDYYRIVSGGG